MEMAFCPLLSISLVIADRIRGSRLSTLGHAGC